VVVAHDAFRALFAANYLHVLRYTERRVDDQQVAEDIAADTFELAWTRLQQGRHVDRPWLFLTASFKLRDHYKRGSRRRAAEAALGRLVEEPTDHLGTLDRMALHDALLSLTEREREAVMLTYWEGLTAAEAAAVLRCSTSAVWVALSRARTKLRGILEPDFTTTGGEHDDR
jgi:RNA polymerase sigma-70 factor (ECF subfamily)